MKLDEKLFWSLRNENMPIHKTSEYWHKEISEKLPPENYVRFQPEIPEDLEKILNFRLKHDDFGEDFERISEITCQYLQDN